MICLRCGHYSHPDREMAREEGSDGCLCSCHAAVMPHGGGSVFRLDDLTGSTDASTSLEDLR